MCHEFRETLESTLGIPFTEGNRIRILRNGNQIFPAMLRAIEEARRTIDFLTYVYWKGDIANRFAEALAARSRAGVRVRVLLDAVGSKPMSEKLVDTMAEAGVEVVWFRPPARWSVWQIDNRTHRKVLICDGRIGFTGGVGVAEEWDGDARTPEEWRDTHFEVRGPAVRGLHAAFLMNWEEMNQSLEPVKEQIAAEHFDENVSVLVMRTSSTVGWSDAKTMLRLLVSMARERLCIATAYFMPDEDTRNLLCAAARRGVRVEVLMPGPHIDFRVVELASESEFRPLLEAGVHLVKYQKTMMHVKSVIVDTTIALVGSVNFNHRSMSKDDEVSMILAGRRVVQELQGDFEDDLRDGTEIDMAHYNSGGAVRHVLRRAARLIKPEL